ncbi:hypothetical protein NFI96_034688 [Prochilodus magdalenae]|nr:hypothetical protein NFI96_034688 [Prochilodus magdalenae]
MRYNAAIVLRTSMAASSSLMPLRIDIFSPSDLEELFHCIGSGSFCARRAWVIHTVEVVPEVGPGVGESPDPILMTAIPAAVAVIVEGDETDEVKVRTAGPDHIALIVAVHQGMEVEAVDTAKKIIFLDESFFLFSGY